MDYVISPILRNDRNPAQCEVRRVQKINNFCTQEQHPPTLKVCRSLIFGFANPIMWDGNFILYFLDGLHFRRMRFALHNEQATEKIRV